MLRFDKATYLSLVFKFILSERLSNTLRGSDVLLFSEFINIVPILSYNLTEFIILLYTFLAISFSLYKEYIIYLVSFSKFSDVLPAFTCTRAIANIWSICLGVNILICLWSKTLRLETVAMRTKSKGCLMMLLETGIRDCFCKQAVFINLFF